MNSPEHPLLPEARLALSDAVRRRTAGRRLRRTPPRRMAVLAVLATLVTGTAVAATTPWHPQLGGHDLGHPTRATRPLPAAELSILGVLRRAQTDADRSPAAQAALRDLPGHEVAGVHTDGVRLLAARSDGDVILIPAERVGPADRHSLRDALCVWRALRHGAAGMNCGDADDLRAGRIRTVTSGLVPDGVRSVRVRLRTGTVLTARVTDNYYELPIDLDLSSRDRRVQAAALARFRTVNGRPIEWFDGHGLRVAKRYGAK
jgi:hypothetical protein